MTTETPRRVDGSMSLLVDMMANTLDEAYAERARSGQPPEPSTSAERRRRRLGPLVGLVLVGLLTGTAVAQVRERQEQTSGVRSGLASEVSERTRTTDELESQAAALRDEVAAARAQALGSDAAGIAAARDLAAIEAASATTAVRGPGIVIVLDDAPTGDGAGAEPLREGTVPEGRVQDRDIQDLVNGLWAAGAEAVAVNGQRLTALTAIRSAGDSILVDLRPLSPPYRVEAVGDTSDLELELVDGPTGRRLTTFTSLYGIVFEVSRADRLTLAGSSTPRLRAATPVVPGGAS